MVIGFERDITDRIVSSTATIKEFGSDTIQPSKEKENLEDYPPILNYADINFTGKFKMDEEEHIPVLLEENATLEGTLDTVTLDLGEKTVKIDADFTDTYSVDAKSLTRQIKNMTVIPDEDCLAQAMVMLWEAKIGAQIKTLVENSRKHMNGFADAVIEITI